MKPFIPFCSQNEALTPLREFVSGLLQGVDRDVPVFAFSQDGTHPASDLITQVPGLYLLSMKAKTFADTLQDTNVQVAQTLTHAPFRHVLWVPDRGFLYCGQDGKTLGLGMEHDAEITRMVYNILARIFRAEGLDIWVTIMGEHRAS